MNHPDQLKILVDEKLRQLRAEGMRSQELHRLGIHPYRPARSIKPFSNLFAQPDTNIKKGWAARLSHMLLVILGLG